MMAFDMQSNKGSERNKKMNRIAPIMVPTDQSAKSATSTTVATRSVLFQSMEDAESRQAGENWVEKHKEELMIETKGHPKVVHPNVHHFGINNLANN